MIIEATGACDGGSDAQRECIDPMVAVENDGKYGLGRSRCGVEVIRFKTKFEDARFSS
jgi:hypothetical protein